MTTASPVQTHPWPGNAQGLKRFTIPVAAKFIVEGGDDPHVKGVATKILRDAGFPRTKRAIAQCVLDWVRKNFGYIDDQPLREWIQSARVSTCAPGSACIVAGDCDDHQVLMGALLRALGVAVQLALIEVRNAQPHVLVVFRDDGGSWLELDSTVADRHIGYVSFGKRTLFDPLDPKVVATDMPDGKFIGVGRPMVDSGPVDPALHLVGAGDATPGDVLAYRAMWNPYVLDIACGLSIQSWALTQAAAGTTPTTIDSQHLAALGLCPNSGSWVPDNTPVLDTSGLAQQPPSAQLLTALAQVASDASDALVTQWNNFSGLSDVQITQQAASVLQAYQDTVLQAGQQYQPMLADHSPALAAALPTGPDKSLQNQLIARIEGAGILARGTLKVIGIGVSGAVTSVGQAVADVGKATFSPWLWVSVAVIAASAATVAVVYVFKTTGAPFKMLRASEMVQTKRRKKRRKMAA